MNKFTKALLFSCLLIAVDKLSYIHPIGDLNITPWNPPAALDVLFLYWAGAAWVVWLFVTLGLADVLVRDIPFFTQLINIKIYKLFFYKGIYDPLYVTNPFNPVTHRLADLNNNPYLVESTKLGFNQGPKN